MSHLSDELWLIAITQIIFPEKNGGISPFGGKDQIWFLLNNEKLFSAKFPYLPPPWSEVCERIANLAFSTTVSTNTTLNKIIYEQNLNYIFFDNAKEHTEKIKMYTKTGIPVLQEKCHPC